jgi:hypothetical protein
LIAIGVPAFSTAQRKGRDARRRADIKTMQDGFEQYYASDNDGDGSTDSEYESCANMWGESDIFPGGAPTDPKSGSYFCEGSSAGYCVCAELETGGGNATEAPSGVSCSFGTGDFYCLTNLQ